MVGGQPATVPMQAIEEAKRQSTFIRNLFCRYSDYLLAQIMQTVACNSLHSIESAPRAGCSTRRTAPGPAGADAGIAGRLARRAADHGQCGRPGSCRTKG